MMDAHTERQTMQPISANVFVAMGSTTTQGFYFDPRGNMIILFTDEFPNPPTCKTTDTVDNRNLILSFFNHLIQFNNEGNRVVFVNSIGYAIDGGKKKGDDIGQAYSLIDNLDNFSCRSSLRIMSEIINEEGNEHLLDIFTVINRNYKTVDREEISGQWTKQIMPYLTSMGYPNITNIVDLGGKSATLYSYGSDNYAEPVFVKKGTYFSGNAPNDLVSIPSNFKEELATELQKMIADHRIDLSRTAILQTGKAREEDIQGIFNEQVAYHGYISRENESIYEAIDFRKTVIQSDSSYGCTFHDQGKGVMRVENMDTWSIWESCCIV